MKTEVREIYRCEYCNKLYLRKHACNNHETACKRNPAYLRPCHSCKVLKKVQAEIWAGYGDPWGNEVERTVQVLFCEKKDCFIYPPSVAAKGNAFDMGNKENIEMPEECDLYVREDGYDEMPDLLT